MEACLRVLSGKKRNHEVPLPEGLFLIGRDETCHLRPHSNLVSRRHCAIACVEGRVLVRDLKSANGTYLNDKQLSGQAMVRDGDVLRVGDLSFSVQIKSASSDPAPPLTEDAFRWLMESPEDSAVLVSDSTVMGEFSLSDDARKALETAADDVQGKGMSAGKFLKDRLKKNG